MVAPTTTETPIERYLRTAKRAGVGQDQAENFLRGGYVALPWALEVHAAAREADRPDGPDEIGAGGSRGPGKSHAWFAQVALDDCQRFEGIKALYLRKIGKNAQEQFDDLRRKVLNYIPHRYNQSKGLIEFSNGSRIITGHFNAEKDVDQYLGLEYEIILIEEATTLSLTKYKALRDSNRSSIPGVRERIYNSTNPGGVGHAWYKKKFVIPYKRGEQQYTRFFPATVDDNRYINPDYKRRLEENTGWRLRAYRYGDWDIAAGQFFTPWSEDIHVIEPEDYFQIPPDWQVWLSMDYGYAHYTVVYLWAKDGDGNVFTIDEHAEQRWQVETHAQAIREMLARNGIHPRRIRRFPAGSDVFVKRDPRSPTIAAQYKAWGFILKPAKMDRINGWAEMLRRLGDPDRHIPPTWRIFRRCKGLIETLPMLEHNPNNPEDVLKVDVDEEGNGGDDYADGARYGIMEAEGGSRIVTAKVDPTDPNRYQKAAKEEPARSDVEVENMLEDYFDE